MHSRGISWVFIFQNGQDPHPKTMQDHRSQRELINLSNSFNSAPQGRKTTDGQLLFTSSAAWLFIETFNLTDWLEFLVDIGAETFKFSLSFNTCLLNLFKRQPLAQYSGKPFTRKSGGREIGNMGPAHCFIMITFNINLFIWQMLFEISVLCQTLLCSMYLAKQGWGRPSHNGFFCWRGKHG